MGEGPTQVDVLAHAYALARANKGAPGVDEQTFEQIESQGKEEWLAGIREELRNKTYQTTSDAASDDPEAWGRRASLGIPTIRDRVPASRLRRSWAEYRAQWPELGKGGVITFVTSQDSCPKSSYTTLCLSHPTGTAELRGRTSKFPLEHAVERRFRRIANLGRDLADVRL